MEQQAQSYLSLLRGIPAKSHWQKISAGFQKRSLILLSYFVNLPGVGKLLQKSLIGLSASIIVYQRKSCMHEAIDVILFILQRPLAQKKKWYFLKWGVTLAQMRQLAPDYRLLQQIDVLIDILNKMPVSHQGYEAAYVYVCLALWSVQRGETELAARQVAMAIKADDTWGYGYFLMGWLACLYNMMDPVPYLMQAISKDWTYFQRVQRDPVLQQYPRILHEVRQQLQVVDLKNKWKRFMNDKRGL